MKHAFVAALLCAFLVWPVASTAQEKADAKPETIEVKGCVKKGVEGGCLILTTSDGKGYSLHGKDLPSLDKKLVVSVKGTTGGVDTCMQGTVVQVESWQWTKMRCPKQSAEKKK